MPSSASETLRAAARRMGEMGAFAKFLADHPITVSAFEAADSASIEAAIRGAEADVDAVANRYPGNDMVRGLADTTKANLRAMIMERAEKARSEDRPAFQP